MLPVATKLAIVGGGALMSIAGFIFLQKKLAPAPLPTAGAPTSSLSSAVSTATSAAKSVLSGTNTNGQTPEEIQAAEDAATAEAAQYLSDNLPSWLGGTAT